MSFQTTTGPLTPTAGTVTLPTSKASEDKMAARQGKDASAPGGVEVRDLREGSHLGWVPPGKAVPGEGGGPGRRAGGSVDCSGYQGKRQCRPAPPHTLPTLRPRLRPPPPSPQPPSATEHRERPLLGVVGSGRRKEDGEGLRAPGSNDEAAEGTVTGTAGDNTHSPSQPVPNKR